LGGGRRRDGAGQDRRETTAEHEAHVRSFHVTIV
jgi:hypothetical protein